MNPLLLLCRAEGIKWRRNWVLVTALLSPVCQVFFLLMIFWFSDIQVSSQGPGFRVWYFINYSTWNLVVMPVSVALLILLSWDVEGDAKAWKHIWLQPVPRSHHYLAKLLGHFSLILVSQIVFALLLLGCGLFMRSQVPGLAMGPALPGLLLQYSAGSLLASLPLIALHTWLSARFPGLGVGLTIALGGSWLSYAMSGTALLPWLPWGMATQSAGMVQQGEGMPGLLVLGGLISTIFLLLPGTLDSRWREEPKT